MAFLPYLLALALAITTASSSSFTITASLIGSSLNGQIINAGGGAFYLGLAAPSTYCPTQIKPHCPEGTSTVLVGMMGQSGIGAMSVMVPGGQQVYVHEYGALGFTQAHSAFIPPGSFLAGFNSKTIPASISEPSRQVISWKAPDASTEGILACPDIPDYMIGIATHQIYARTPKFNLTDCVVLEGLLPSLLPVGPPTVWQYT